MEKSAMVKTRPVNGFFAFIRQRARWASKSSGYRDSLSLMTAGSVFSMAVVMSAYFIVGFIYPLSFLFFGGLVMIKALVDFPLLSMATKFTGDHPLMKWLLPFEAVYPFYVVTAGILSIFRRNKW
jgi:cellulose synthase/poly-beta-1,6-N-acetylglucosamine synthase-like glycosyltransferase